MQSESGGQALCNDLNLNRSLKDYNLISALNSLNLHSSPKIRLELENVLTLLHFRCVQIAK